MTESTSDRRLAENEVIYRQLNERIKESFDHINKLATEDNQPEFRISYGSGDAPMLFFCECSDEKCKQRIHINLHDYTEIHKNRRRFIIKSKHEVAKIERVIREEVGYSIVEKKTTPPRSADRFKKTGLNHS